MKAEKTLETVSLGVHKLQEVVTRSVKIAKWRFGGSKSSLVAGCPQKSSGCRNCIIFSLSCIGWCKKSPSKSLQVNQWQELKRSDQEF